ncbi:hypothetical protein AC529_08045 [Thermobifida cellulosilytica TB100]|uniref:DUF3995 domain-containing protein n=1 Tax=Thermobifida cellulosilytica TB100 TaxID=665004 RepID=A0A147KIR4_THECS|nr:hypothetical protein AC529_08045 [Thermobifida cellulosilytica TB100]
MLDGIGVPRWPAYGAAVWALLFAAVSFYWALGGTALLDTIGEAVTGPALSGDPAVVAAVWLSALLKLAGVPGALALAQRWGTLFPRWLVLLAGWGVTALLCLYGGASLVQQVLMVAGVVDVSAAFRPVLLWHLFLWTPVWLAGGVLYGIATFFFARATRVADAAPR